MISLIRAAWQEELRVPMFVGLSTDGYPDSDDPAMKNGARIYHMDTAKEYEYSKDDDDWYEVPSGGGGTSPVPPPTVDNIGKVLGIVENGAGAKYAPVDGGQMEVLTVEVTATYDPETENLNFTADHTAEEIIEAINSGNNVKLYYADFDRNYSLLRYDQYVNSVTFLSLEGYMYDDSSLIPPVNYGFALVDVNGNAYLSNYGVSEELVSGVVDEITEETMYELSPPSTYAVYDYVQSAIGDAIGGSY